MQFEQSPILRWWRDLPKYERKTIMHQKAISAITYEQIKTIYNESKT